MKCMCFASKSAFVCNIVTVIIIFPAECICLWQYAHKHVHVCFSFCFYDHLPGCDFSDSGGYARKCVALSLMLSPMKRVQSSPNLATGTNTHKHTNEHNYFPK